MQENGFPPRNQAAGQTGYRGWKLLLQTNTCVSQQGKFLSHGIACNNEQKQKSRTCSLLK
jgi:hypothetical protein